MPLRYKIQAFLNTTLACLALLAAALLFSNVQTTADRTTGVAGHSRTLVCGIVKVISSSALVRLPGETPADFEDRVRSRLALLHVLDRAGAAACSSKITTALREQINSARRFLGHHHRRKGVVNDSGSSPAGQPPASGGSSGPGPAGPKGAPGATGAPGQPGTSTPVVSPPPLVCNVPLAGTILCPK